MAGLLYEMEKTVQFTNHNSLFTTGIRTFPEPHDAEITLISVFLGNKKRMPPIREASFWLNSYGPND